VPADALVVVYHHAALAQRGAKGEEEGDDDVEAEDRIDEPVEEEVDRPVVPRSEEGHLKWCHEGRPQKRKDRDQVPHAHEARARIERSAPERDDALAGVDDLLLERLVVAPREARLATHERQQVAHSVL
jgi:hypothetical protein